MFRGLKKRVQSLGDSRHSSRGEGTHGDSGKQPNDSGKLNTPRREAAPSTANNNNNNGSSVNGSTATTATASPYSFVSSSSGVATNTSSASASASSARKTVQKKLSRAVRQQQQEEEDLLHAATNNQGVPYLSAFDKCIEMSDAMTASSSAGQNDSVLTTRQDATTGLPDCSLLVSPNGDLLLLPTLGQAGQQRPEDMFRNMRRRDNNNNNTAKEQGLPDSKGGGAAAAAADEEDADAEKGDDAGLNDLSTANSFSELMLHGKDDYESAVFCGNDLNVAGDKNLNRFTTKGWSIPATSLALQQTGHSLTALAHFAEQLVLSRKESAARATIACDNLRSETEKRTFHLNMGGGLEQWEILDPRATDFEFVPGRVGPFQAHGTSTLRKAIAAMEQYHSHTAEKESRRWRAASLQLNGNGNGVLPAMHEAVDHFHRRASNRERALQETSRRASVMEERLRRLKQESEKKWEAVYKAETRVTRRLEEFMTERSKERARVRLNRLRAEETQRRAAAADEMVDGVFGGGGGEGGGRVASLGGGTGTTTINTSSSMSDEVWNLVSSVAESMDNGSFEPVSLEANDAVASVVSDDASAASSVAAEHNLDAAGSVHSTGTSSVTPIVSREEIEQEVGLPELRAAALMADDDIQDAADALLNILAALDTTRRSARIAAETCLVSAANAHAACLRSMLKLERESLQERLNDLDGLEEQLEQIDVRADLDAYICGAFSWSGWLLDDDPTSSRSTSSRTVAAAALL